MTLSGTSDQPMVQLGGCCKAGCVSGGCSSAVVEAGLRTVVRPGRWCTSHTAEVAAGARSYTATPHYEAGYAPLSSIRSCEL